MTHEFYLASYPRSGNTLTRLLLEHHFDIDTRETNTRKRRRAKQVVLQNPHTKPTASRSDLDRLSETREGLQGTAYKTHKNIEDNLPVLVLVRDGRDAMVSYAHYSIDVMGVNREFSELLASRVKGTEWSQCYQWWVGGGVLRVPYVLITYETLLKHQAKGTAANYLQKALRKLEFEFDIKNPDPLPSFEHYQKAKPDFFRRGIIGSWRDEMPAELEETFWKGNGATMEWLGYAR